MIQFLEIWEEFKYQVQREESVMFGAYADTITAICQNLVGKFPQHEQDLLWLVSESYFDWNEKDEPADKAADVVNELYCRVCRRAFMSVKEPPANIGLFCPDSSKDWKIAFHIHH